MTSSHANALFEAQLYGFRRATEIAHAGDDAALLFIFISFFVIVIAIVIVVFGIGYFFSKGFESFLPLVSVKLRRVILET